MFTYIAWRDNIVAKVAAEALLAGTGETVAHDEVRVESQRCVNNELALRSRKQCRQPAALTRVCAKEDDIVRADKLQQLRQR